MATTMAVAQTAAAASAKTAHSAVCKLPRRPPMGVQRRRRHPVPDAAEQQQISSSRPACRNQTIRPSLSSRIGEAPMQDHVAKRWRLRAEEYRAIGAGSVVAENRRIYDTLASDCDRIAA